MIALSQIFYGLFTAKEVKPSATPLVQTALEPVHEEDTTQGCEFLDDFTRLDEQPEDETK